MKTYIRRILAVGFSIAGWVLSFYVGAWLLFVKPVHFLLVTLGTGNLTKRLLIICIVKIFFAATAGGAVWCVFDIIAGKFRDE